MSTDVCPCGFCRAGRRVRGVVTSETFLLLITAIVLGLLFGALIGGWGGILG